MKYTFTPSLFFQHATCPHWIWHDRYTDPARKGELPELAQKLMEQGVLHEERYIQDLDISSVEAPFGAQAIAQTRKLMESGVPYIYQAAIRYQTSEVDFQGRPDLLERRVGASKYGNYYYAPIDIKSSSDIKREQWMQLAMYADILEHEQGSYPVDVAIINRDGDRLDHSITDAQRQKTTEKISEILQVMSGVKPALKLVSKCKSSPWFLECIRDAEAANDIALIYKLDSRAIEGLRTAGISTIKQLATLDFDALPHITQLSAQSFARAQLQAQSLISGKVIWFGSPDIPKADIKIYFDIEGDPLLQVEYLFGFWVVGDTNHRFAKYGEIRDYPDQDKYYIYFLARTPDEESMLWKRFLQWIALLNGHDYVIYHFADYERVKTTKLAKQYGGEKIIETFLEKFVDLSRVIQQSVIFPLYFYSIKDIAKSKFVDYKWRHPKAGGAQSIFWYEKWLETNDNQVLVDIINYNEDDVVATEYLHHWLLIQLVKGDN